MFYAIRRARVWQFFCFRMTPRDQRAYKKLFCDGDKFWCSEIERKSTEQNTFQWRIF